MHSLTRTRQVRWPGRLLGSLTLLSLTTCAGSPASTSDACAWDRVITITTNDQLDPSTARQIDTHNKQVMALCRH